MEDNKQQAATGRSYIVYIPGTSRGEQWDEAKWERNKDKLMADHKDAQVVELSPLGQGEDIAEGDTYSVYIPGTSAPQQWDGAKLSRNWERLYADHPNVAVNRLSAVNYYGDKLNDINTEIERLESDIDSASHNAAEQVRDADLRTKRTFGVPEQAYAVGASLESQSAQEPVRKLRARLDELYRQRDDNPEYQRQKTALTDYLKSQEDIVQGEIDKLNADAKTRQHNVTRTALNPFAAADDKDDPTLRDDAALRSAKLWYNDALKTANAPSRYGKETGFANFLRGLIGEAPETLTPVALSKSIAKNSPVISAIKDIHNNEGEYANIASLVMDTPEKLDYLSPAQMTALRAFVTKSYVDASRAKDLSLGFQAGQSAMQSLGFMLDFYGAGGLGNAAAKGATKALTRSIAKVSSRAGLKGLGRDAALAVPKFAVGTLQSAIKSLSMSPFMPSTYANMLDSMTAINDAGEVDLSGDAILQSVGDALIENLSESAGVQVEAILGAPLGVIGKSGLGQRIATTPFGKWGQAIKSSPAAKILKQAGWNGFIGEIGEEWYGNAVRVMTGVDKDALKNFATVDQQIITVASFAPMSILGGATSAVQYKASKIQMDNAAKHLEDVLHRNGYDDQTIRNYLDVTKAETPAELGERLTPAIVQAVADNADAPSVYRAVMDYASAVARWRTFDGISASDISEQRQQAEDAITASMGGEREDNKWIRETLHQLPDKSGIVERSVRMLTDANGVDYFVQAEGDDGSFAAVDRQGMKHIISREQLNDMLDTGDLPLNDFLDRELVRIKAIRERDRMQADKQANRQALLREAYNGREINIGTADNLQKGTVRQYTNGKFVVQTADGSAIEYTENQMAAALNMTLDAQTDEQIEDAAANEFARRRDLQKRANEAGKSKDISSFVGEEGVTLLEISDPQTDPETGVTTYPTFVRRASDGVAGLTVLTEEQVTAIAGLDESISNGHGEEHENGNLSNEKDENGHSFVLSSSGSTIFGEINKESGLQSAPIKLSEGFNTVDDNGNNVGYGRAHIEAGHGKEIRDAGYSSIEEFVEDVAKHYGEIRIGRGRKNNTTYMLLEYHDEKHNRTLYVELSNDGFYWNVNSGGIFRNGYTDNKDIVWPEPTMGSSKNAVTTEVAGSPEKTESGVTAYRGGDSSQPISTHKDSENSEAVNSPSALSRIPVDERGNPLYEQADADTAWDAIVEQTSGDEDMAKRVASSMLEDKKAALQKAEKSKVKSGTSIADKIAAEKAHQDAVDKAKSDVAAWQSIVLTSERRRSKAAAQRREQLARQKAEEQKAETEAADKARKEREFLNGVPDMVDDKPVDARARGYRNVNGYKVDRQTSVDAIKGKDITVKFSDKTAQKGRIAIIDVGMLQPSHIGGVRNPAHFLDEAQPKERNDKASIAAAEKIAANIRPEEITSSVTAYVGAPAVNARGEVIQGNNRSAALRLMWERYPDQAAIYKQYLKDHAVEFGIKPEDINGVEHPVLVNMLDVTDEQAITLGQFVAQDTESGGTERIKPKNVAQKMGADTSSGQGEVGPFGKIFRQFKGKAEEAIAALKAEKGGEAVGALHHPDIGEIDLIWGEEGTGHSDGFGLAKIVKFHPEVADNLQEILLDMSITSRSDNRVQLESKKYKATVRLSWDEQQKTWLLTAFEKKNSVPDNTTDTDEASNRSERNDTTTPQNTVSDGKNSEISGEPNTPTENPIAAVVADAYKKKTVSGGSSDIVPESSNEDKPNGTAPLQNTSIRDKVTEKADKSNDGRIKSDAPLPEYGSQNKVITKDKYKELLAQWRNKQNSLNSGFDPETMFIGLQLAAYHIEAGARLFTAFAKALLKDAGESIRPYLKSFYNGARDFPGMEAYKAEMDPAADVDAIDINAINAANEAQEQEKSSTRQEIDTNALFGAVSDLAKGKSTEVKISDFAKKQDRSASIEKGKDIDSNNTPLPDREVHAVGEIGKYTHTKTGKMMTIVRLTGSRLSSDEFKKLKARAKELGGYYSSFGSAKGFLFDDEEDAVKFNTIEDTSRNGNEITDEQTGADTAALVGEAGLIAEKAQSLAEDEGAVDEGKANEAIDAIDKHLDKVNGQLAILGYYKADTSDDSSSNERYGYLKSAETKAVADVDKLAKKLADDLGLEVGRKRLAKANIAPAGGEVSFRLPLKDGYELYMSITLVPNDYRPGGFYGEDLIARGVLGMQGELAIFFRVENPKAGGMDRYMTGNNFQPYNITYSELLKEVRRDARNYIPEQPNAYEGGPVDIVQVAKEQAEKSRKSKEKAISSQREVNEALGDLFATLNGAETSEESTAEEDTERVDETPVSPTEVNGFRKGDRVLYTPSGKGQPIEAIIYDFDYDGRPVLDAGLAPIAYDVTDWDNVKSLNTKQNEQQLERDSSSAGTEGQLGGDRLGGGEAQAERGVGESAREESRGTDARGAGEGEPYSGTGRPLRRVQGLESKRNTRNNRVSRGEAVYPKTETARYEANIAAIRLLKELQDSGKQATKEQMAVLRRFTGWGGLGGYFNNTYSNEYRELRSLLTDEEMRAAELSINTAFYTPVEIIDAMWDIAKQMGFSGGKVLEGSAGIGNILASMPKSMSEASEITAVELDGISGGILRLLYPDTNVMVTGFQDADIDNSSVDLAITNVPFSNSIDILDTKEKDLTRKFGHRLHDFCIAKNLRKLKEGGIGIFITTRGTLDGQESKKLREWVTHDGDSDFIGAFRLNNKTFSGTGATSDIVVVRRRVNGQVSPEAIDLSRTSITRRETYGTGKFEWNKSTFEYEETKADAVMEVNDWFIEHPEDMGGEMLFGFDKKDTFRPGSAALYPKYGIDQLKRLSEWVKTLKNSAEDTRVESSHAGTSATDASAEESSATKEGQLVANSKGEICVSRRGKAVPLGVNAQRVRGYTKAEVLENYNTLKSAINEALDYQLRNDSDESLKPLLDKLNTAYDTFTKRYGPLHKNRSLAFLRNDVDYAATAAIEDYEEDKTIEGKVNVSVKKTDIFSKRILGMQRIPTPKDVRDGVITSYNQFGRIDIPFIAKALGKSVGSVRDEALSMGMGFENPETGNVEVSFKYLSGNVREKLDYAKAHNANGRYDENIKALEKVVPLDIPAHLIEFTLGSDWLEPQLYTDYAKEKFGLNDKFQPRCIGGAWEMPLKDWEIEANNEKNRQAGVTSESLGATKYGHELMLKAMNNTPVVFTMSYKDGDGEHTETDKIATQAAEAKIAEMRDDFREWCRAKMLQEPDLAQRIQRVYNDTFNSIVPMEIDDTFVPKHFKGQVLEMDGKPFDLYPHQAKAVIRATMQPLMMAHEVGTGKTYSLIATAMEYRRLGMAKKPMIVVQNSTVGQFVSSAKELYPQAKILTMTESDRTQEGRAAFYAKIKYNDWDMIIIPQSVFDMIPDSEERKRALIQEKIDEKIFVINQAKESGNESSLRDLKNELEDLEYERDYNGEKRPKKGKRNAKKEAEAEENAATKARKQLSRKTDDVSDFDDMGIDALLVDEAHMYKHLGFSTSMKRGIKGVDSSYSERSAGLYLKVHAIFDKVGWRNVVFATGTPISNTAAEIWTFMKYLMPADEMRKNHIYYFDDFVRNFGRIEQTLEFATNGKFKEQNRFSAYTNLPELIRIWSVVTDTRLTKDAIAARKAEGEIEKLADKIPVMQDWTDENRVIHKNQARDIFLPQSPSLRRIMTAVRKALEEYEKMSGKEKRQHSQIPLTMYGIAARAAIDPRLVDSGAVDEAVSKTNEAVKEILKDLKDTEKYKGTTAVFSDVYCRKDITEDGERVEAFNLFDEIKRKLVEAGVPSNKIVIIKSGMSVDAKERAFARVNSGDVRVIMGTTAGLGTGVNIQERLYSEYHLDAPNRPMDYTQRTGRILRQGNLHKKWGIPVKIVRFGVKDSLDVTAYQRLATKSKFINSVMDYKPLLANVMELRVLEEDEEGLFDNPVAVLSGSQFAMLKAAAERELRKLKSKKEQYEQDQIYIERKLKDNKRDIERQKNAIELEKKRLAEAREIFPKGEVSNLTIDGIKVNGEERIATVIKERITGPIRDFVTKNRDSYSFNEKRFDYRLTFNGVPVTLTANVRRDDEWDETARKFVHTTKTQLSYSCPEFGIDTRRAGGGINGVKNLIQRFVSETASGKEFEEAIANYSSSISRMESDDEVMLKRRGKPFADEDKLKHQEEIVKDYTEKMKEEMKEKEKEYASMAEENTSSFNLDNAVEAQDDTETDDDEDTHYRSADNTAPSATLDTTNPIVAAQAIAAVNRLAKKLGLRVVYDSELESKGAYTVGTDYVRINLANCESVDDAVETLLHEGVAHFGLREMLDEDGMKEFISDILAKASPSIRAKIEQMSQENGWDMEYAAEEYVAELAQKTDYTRAEHSFWREVLQAIRNLISRITGRETYVTDDTIRKMLVASYENLEGRTSNVERESEDEFGGEGVTHYRVRTKQNGKTISINDRAAQKEYLLGDNFVSHLSGKEFEKEDEPLTKRVAKYYAENYGGKIERDNIGEVILDERGVKDSLLHGIGRNKAAAFAAVPEIIRDGAIIDAQANWKGRNRDSYTIAAPIEIGGEGYVGVAIVIHGAGTNNNHFYLHEVALQKSLHNESVKTGTEADPHQGDIAKLLKEIANANSDNIRFRTSNLEDIDELNARFNEELQEQIDGTQEKGHVYQLGKPGTILRSTGFPDAPIELSASHLAEKASAAHHPFNISEISGLPHALQHPLAVFAYGDKAKAQNAVVEIQHGDKNFIIGVHFNQARRGLIVSDIRGLYPKDNAEWLNWISQGKALYIDKKKIQTLLDQQRRTLAEVDYLDLDSVAKIVNFFENPNLIRFRIEDDGAAVPIQREATGEGNKRDHLTAQSSPILYLQSTAEKEAAVRDAAMKCGVEIELKPAREMTFNGKPLAGYWKDGKMYVCIEHCRDANDAVRTVLHEAVGHNGLRKLIGNDNMHAFCRDVYQGLLVEARRQIARKAVVQYGGNLAEATEEYLAEQAEIMDFEDGDYERNFWDTVREAIRKVLAKIGINIHLTQRDVRWLMWQSYNANKQGDILNEVKRQVVAHKLGFNLTQRAYESDGVQAVRFRRAIDEQSLNDAQLYDRAVNNVFGRLKESFVDMYQSVDEVIKQMEKSSGKKASEFEDPRLALNQQSSKALAALDNWDRYYNLPMKKAVLSLMQAMGGRIEDVERYVMLKHGLERNKLFAKRDALARHEKDHEDKLRRIARATSISKEDKQELIEAENARYERKKADVEAERDSVYLKLRKRDYSGLSSFYSEYPANMKQEKGETDEEYAARLYASRMPIAEFADENGNADLALMEQAAQKEIEAIVESAHKVQTDELWKRINAATKKTLKEQYDANVLSHAQYEELRDMFEYYVPLRGFADKTAEDFYDYYRNGGHGAFIPLVQKAKGRSSKAASPFGYIAAAESNAIAQNVKNEAKLTLYYFISNRPHSDIMTASETWFEKVGTDDEGRSIFRAVYPEFEDDLSRDEAKQAFEKWEKNMQEKAAAGLAYKGRNKVSIAGGVIRTVGKTSLSHVIPFKLAGRDMMFLVNANPRIAQAFNGELNYNAETNPVTRWLQGAMRLMSSLNTEMNPEFWISNLQRDLLFAMMSVNIKESKEYQREYQKNLSDSCKNIVRLKKSYDNGTIGDGRLERLYKSFVDNGGVTGYTVIHDNAFWERQLRVFAGEEKDHLAAARKAVRAVSDFGEAIEQIGRFTAFVTSVEQGKDIRRAIADAKELTVNFNRKGSGKGIKPEEARKLTWGKGGRRLTAAEGFIVSAISYMAPYGRRAIMFFNASIQGLNATVKLFGQNTPKALAWSGVYILLGAAQAALHAMLDGDDDDDKDGYLDIPDWERRNNALVGFNGVYFKWALPQEMRAFYGLGDMVVNHALGREPNKNIVPEFLSSVLDVSPVNPAEGVRAFAPAALVPAIDIWTNEDYKGAKVHNEHRYYDEEQQRNVPKWRDPLRNTSDVSIALTKILSAMTGGDDYKAGWLNADPNNLEHLWEGYTGGLGTTAEKTIHFVENAFEGEFRVKDTPFLRRMLVIGDERYRNSHTSDLFYYYRDIAQRQSRMIKEAILKGDSDKVKELTSGKDYDIMNIYNSYDGQMKYYDDAIREADDDEKKELMEEQDALRKEMIQDISDLD